MQHPKLTMLKNTKAETKSFSPRSLQHCLYFLSVSTESITSRCTGYRWLPATSIAQIQDRKNPPLLFIKSLLWPLFYCSSSIWKNATNAPMESVWHLKWKNKYFSHMHIMQTVTKRTSGFCSLALKLEMYSRNKLHGAAAMPHSTQVMHCTFLCHVSNFTTVFINIRCC